MFIFSYFSKINPKFNGESPFPDDPGYFPREAGTEGALAGDGVEKHVRSSPKHQGRVDTALRRGSAFGEIRITSRTLATNEIFSHYSIGTT